MNADRSLRRVLQGFGVSYTYLIIIRNPPQNSIGNYLQANEKPHAFCRLALVASAVGPAGFRLELRLRGIGCGIAV